MTYLSDSAAKRQIVEIGRRMYEKDFVAANDGNISVRVAPDEVWTTPTGVSKGFLLEDELVKVRLDGTVLERGELGMSSEARMHLRVYQENPTACGVCHAHPPVSTAFSIAGIALDQAIYPEALVTLGIVPCVHYETPGSPGVPESIVPYARKFNAVLLGNHGPVTWGQTLTEAWYRLESIEHYAKILMYTSYIIGKANALTDEQIAKLLEIRGKLGTTAGGAPHGAPYVTNGEDVIHGIF